jgi:Immunity protein 35
LISRQKGRLVAESIAAKLSGREVVVQDELTLERTSCWVFFYQSREYVDEPKRGNLMVGNAPIIVDRDDGAVSLTGTAFPIEDYVRAYETLGRERFDRGEWRAFLADLAPDDE